MLPIRQTLNALSALNRTAKAVLIEVCELAEHGTHGCCTAKNEYLVGRLGGTERTISRTLTTLERRGLLVSQGQGKARRLAPTPTLRACYASPDEAVRQAAVAGLNLDKPGALDAPNLDILDTQPSQSVQVAPVTNLANLDKMGAQPRQNGSTNLDKMGVEPRQNGSRVLGDDQYDQVDEQEALSAQERDGFQKKIGELENENARLRSLLAQVQASHTGGAAGGYRAFGADWPVQLHPPFPSREFRQAWAKYAGYLAELGKPFRGHQHEDAALQKLRRLVGTDHALALKALADTMANGWYNLNLDHSKAPEKVPKTGQAAERLSTIDETLQARRARRGIA